VAAPADLPRRLAICRQIMHHARAARWSVVHVLRRSDEPCERGELGAAPPYPGLEPSPFETVYLRRQLSAFSLPEFERLAQSARDNEAIAVALSLGPACLLTAIDAHERGVRMTLVDDVLSPPTLSNFASDTVRGVLLGVVGSYLRRMSAATLLDIAVEPGTRPAANQH
jgi:hypothetical protein